MPPAKDPKNSAAPSAGKAQVFYAMGERKRNRPDGFECVGQYASVADLEQSLAEYIADDGESPEYSDGVRFYKVTIEELPRTANAKSTSIKRPAGGKQ